VLAGGNPLIWPQHGISDQLRETHWDDVPILAIAAAATLLGLTLIVSGLTPGKRLLVPLAGDDPQVTAGIARRDLREAISDAAVNVDGVRSVRVRLRRGSATVLARSVLRDTTGLDQTLDEAVGRRLDGIRPVRPLSVEVKVVPRKAG
jgi:hypothetical protein